MLSTLLRSPPRLLRTCNVSILTRWTSSSAKPRILLLDPINLAKDDLATLEKEATLIVSPYQDDSDFTA